MTRSATMLVGGDDTIVARATPDGRGALAVIRLSGARAIDIARALGAFERAPVHRTVMRCALRHPFTKTPLDDALVTPFCAPNTFTGEEIVELSTHGGRVVVDSVMAACVAAGARLALAGEFARRAVVNGKMDVLQAEAMADLIDARTTSMQRQALTQMDGGLSRRVLSLRDDVLHVEALLAYDIDFPDEDDGPIAPMRITTAATQVRDAIDALLASAPRAAIVRDGACVVIAGPPNAGKSSLFNALLGESRALVTEIAGTTRDAVDALLDRAPTPLRLVDTAGMRDTTDTLERLGIEVSERFLGTAHVVLACGASVVDVQYAISAVRRHTSAPVLGVRTKCDVPVEETAPRADWCYVSAESGQGVSALLTRLDAVLGSNERAHEGEMLITRERHQRCLREAREEIAQFLDGWSSGALPATVAAVHLLAARDALSNLVGAIGTEDILDRVFADFCIGK